MLSSLLGLLIKASPSSKITNASIIAITKTAKQVVSVVMVPHLQFLAGGLLAPYTLSTVKSGLGSEWTKL